MTRVLCIVLALGLAAATPAAAQFAPPNPDLEGRIPAPLPPPPQPPVINGPLGEAPPPGVAQPRRLRTHSDRTIRCQQDGASSGLRGADLDTYTRSCVTAH